MPFKLVIRHSIGDHSDEFAGADVYRFDDVDVTVGSDPSCDCVIDDQEEISPCHFTINFQGNEDCLLTPQKKVSLFLNNKPVLAPAPLTSGDEIRIGHWTFRFQKEYGNGAIARRTDIMGGLAKLIIVVVLVMELFFVYWLPRRIQSERLLAEGIIHQQTVMQLDQIRQRARRGGQDFNTYQEHANKLVLDELDRLAMFIRNHETELNEDQWKRAYDAATKLGESLQRIRQERVEHPLPEPSLEKSVQALLREDGKEKP